MNLRNSPLRAEHEALSAKMVDFGGWEMPLSYPSGTVAEHLACRRGAVAFDVSHLGTVRVEGPDAFDLLQSSLSNDLRKVAPGKAQYTHLLDDDASVLDDIIVWWVAPERFDVMPNASNTERVVSVIGGEDVTAERAIIAVQGPEARDRLAAVSADAAAVSRFGVASFTFEGVGCLVAGTGYTGEDGVECAIPIDVAPAFWRAVLGAGVEPAGLGARDTLRLEAGLPLHGHELGPGINPLEARLGWVVGWDKGPFRGRSELQKIRARGGPARLLCGLLSEARRPPRAGDEIFDVAAIDGGSVGQAVGQVTSGNFSPILQRGIALGFLPVAMDGHGHVGIETRGTRAAATVVRPPFHRLTRGATA